MQIARFQTFINESRNDFLSRPNVQEVAYYYVYNSSWFDESSKEVTDPSLIKLLEKCQVDQSHFHAPKSTDAYFPISSLRAVLKISFQASPRKKTRDSFASLIHKNLEHAENSFKVSHNQLTGLWAKDAFIKIIEDALGNLYSAPLSGETGSPDIDSANALCIYALDIDLFKQVNDSYGHLYGDLVLKSFAVRLARAARQFQDQHASRIKIEVAHFSGEEFFALAIGNAPIKLFRDFGEFLKAQISDHELPSDEEFDLFSGQFGSPLIVPPPRSARNVSASIGVSLSSDIGVPKDVRSGATILLDQSDIALYKSKASGRNCVTMFSEILERCGRVLEYRSDNGVVTIDIGRRVNVARGQEFRVFHPDFCGKTPFTLDDGRTKRALGTYPKIETGRIVVFDVQKDISFCRVTPVDGSDNIAIVAGSMLEAIPVGAIGHIIAPAHSNASFPGETVDIATTDEVSGKIKKLADSESNFAVACFRIQNDKDILEKYGSIFVNRALAQLYLSIKEAASPKDTIGQLDPVRLVFVSDKGMTSEEFGRWMNEAISRARNPFEQTVEFVAGAFVSSDAGSLKRIKALEMARYAVSDEGLNVGQRVEVFSNKTAERILGTWRDRREAKKGLVDYRHLKECGVVSGQFENHAGLIASNSGDLAMAASCYKEAARISPQNPTFLLNIASAEYKLGNWKAALDIINQVGAPTIRARAWPWFQVVYALTLYSDFKHDPSPTKVPELKLALDEALAAYDEKETGYYKMLEQGLREVEAMN